VKVIAFVLAFTMFVAPIQAVAGDLFISTRIQVRDPEAYIKEVPEELRQQLGENYVLIDLTYLNKLDQAAQERDVFKVTLDEILLELDEFKLYSTRLERAIKQQTDHIDLLNNHIDYQEDVIADLAPTWWDKNKFTFGVILGGVTVGGMAYGLSKLD